MIEQKMLIGGEWTKGAGSETITVINPATEEVIATAPAAVEQDIEEAVNVADAAFGDWSRLTPYARGALLREASEYVRQSADRIAMLMTMEQGKPLAEAKGEVLKGADILRYYAEEGERVCGRIIPGDKANVESRVIYQPIGVAAAISPWNYPIELLAWKLGGALAAGCTIVCKLPSETPLSPLMFIECMLKAPFPRGVVNAATGKGAAIGPLLLKNPKIKKVAFTGSTAVGREVLANSMPGLKKVSLELGGSLPMIVHSDCDLEKAGAGAVRRSFRNMGQICIAVNRIYVQRRIYEEFLSLFKAKAEALIIGDGAKEACDVGPMCTLKGIETTQRHIEDALEKGATLVCGGSVPRKRGYFFEPSILRDVNHGMLVMREETFGPLVGVMPYDELDEAIALANDTDYGLAAIVYTNSLYTAKRCADEIQAGNIAVNNPDAGVMNAPYGGWKDSGFGHEHGPEGLYEYLRIKHVKMCYKP